MFILTTGNADNSACEKNKAEGPLYSPEAAVAFVGVEAAA